MAMNKIKQVVEGENMVLLSRCSSDKQGETKSGRRRKKAKGEASGGGKKRKLSAEQVHFLEMNFGNEHKLETARKDRLAAEIGLDPRQVAVWFQNRRARWKNKQLEEEYFTLKSKYEGLVMEKCQIEAQVVKLTEQLSEAQKEVQRLSESSDGERSCISSVSLSMDAYHPFFGEFGCEENDSFLYMNENSYSGVVEWYDYVAGFTM